MRKADGWREIARPMATRWRSPPESWPGSRSRTRSIPSILAVFSMRSLWSARGFSSFSGKPMFSRLVMVG